MSPRTGSAFFQLRAVLAIAILLVFPFTFAACDFGTGIKTLGSNALDSGQPVAGNSDTFAVTVAYRNPANDATTPIRTVEIQGTQGASGSASISSTCGTTGSNCACIFYRSSTDPSPIATSVSGISVQNNSATCTIPSSMAITSGMFVVLQDTANTGLNSGLLSIETVLTLQQVIGGNLNVQDVRGIYRYQCSRTFFEGEGVSASNVTCTAGQHLGLITASYNFYLYESQVDNNMNLRGTSTPFPSSICNLTQFQQTVCSSGSPSLEYGFYNASANAFTVGITMTAAPSGTNVTSVYGYASLPDSSGNCPTGLVQIRPWVAIPASIIVGSNVGGTTEPYPTSFINTSATLNDTMVEPTQPANFTVYRQPNSVPCVASGDCSTAQFGGQTTAESVVYTSETPIVCAIPSNLITGL